MIWTNETPTEPGRYLIWPVYFCEPELVKVFNGFSEPDETDTQAFEGVECMFFEMHGNRFRCDAEKGAKWFGPIPGPDVVPTPQPSELEKLRDEVPGCHAIDANWCINYAPKSWHVWVDSSLGGWWDVRGEGATLSDAIAEARKQLAVKRKEQP